MQDTLTFNTIAVQTITDKPLVQDVSFSIAKSEIVFLSGRNGSGKSSFLNGVFRHPDYKRAGQILLDGEDISDLKTHELARKGLYLALQMVPEIEGVSLVQFLYKGYKSINPKSALSILDFNKQLMEHCNTYSIDPNFLKRNLNVGMSGGEKKKAELLHLLALAPRYAFLDEPDSGLDQESIATLTRVIQDMNSRTENPTAFVIISHGETLKKNIQATREYTMENGLALTNK